MKAPSIASCTFSFSRIEASVDSSSSAKAMNPTVRAENIISTARNTEITFFICITPFFVHKHSLS